MNTGVFTLPSLAMLDRAAANDRTRPRLVPENAAAWTGSSSGERRSAGIEPERPATRPDLTRPPGASAVYRTVHVSATSTAAHGTPAASEFQIAPPPYEIPQPPIFGVRDVGSRAQPVEHRARVGHLTRAVDADEPPGGAVAARVERQHCVVGAYESVRLGEGVHLGAVAREAVQEDDRRPAARRAPHHPACTGWRRCRPRRPSRSSRPASPSGTAPPADGRRAKTAKRATVNRIFTSAKGRARAPAPPMSLQSPRWIPAPSVCSTRVPVA